MYSEFLKLSKSDCVKSLVILVISALATCFSNAIVVALQGTGGFDYKEVGKVALIAFFSYLGKNLFTNSSGKFGSKE